MDRGVERTRGIDEPAELAELTGMQSIFARNIIYQGGDYGNAVLTRLPVMYEQNHFLPRTVVNEQRGCSKWLCSCRGRPFLFLATHFDYHADDRERARVGVNVVRTLHRPQRGSAGHPRRRPERYAGFARRAGSVFFHVGYLRFVRRRAIHFHVDAAHPSDRLTS